MYTQIQISEKREGKTPLLRKNYLHFYVKVKLFLLKSNKYIFIYSFIYLN